MDVLAKVYVVIVGIFRYVRHYSMVRKRGPNCKIVIDTNKGPNDGFATLVAWSQNGSGVSPRSPFLGTTFAFL